MTTWKRGSPDSVQGAADFERAVKAAVELAACGIKERVPLGKIMTRQSSKSFCDKFRKWRWRLRQYPFHKMHRLETDYDLQLKLIQLEGSDLVQVMLSARRVESVADLQSCIKIE